MYRITFEKYRQPADTPLSNDYFDKKFVRVEERIDGLKAGTVRFEQDKDDLNNLMSVMGQAAKLPVTRKRLSAYKTSKRVRRETEVSRTRAERYCSYFGEYSQQCLVYNTRTVPYIEKGVSLELPNGILSPVDVFALYHDAYFKQLEAQRRMARTNAVSEREKILSANAKGKESLWLALEVAGAFMILVFFFLLVAIERHQRKIASGI